jgi:DNA-binding NarL/FixJ family response regulator
LRAAQLTRTIPVVVLTSSTKYEDVAAAYRLGCNGYLSKGVDYRHFVDSAKIAVQYWLVYNVTSQRWIKLNSTPEDRVCRCAQLPLPLLT